MDVHKARRQREDQGSSQKAEPEADLPEARLANVNVPDIEEAQRLRRLQVMMSMVMSVISQDPDLTLEEAAEMSANARRAALTMFPDKELAYDLIYRPRLQRLMNERFRLQ